MVKSCVNNLRRASCDSFQLQDECWIILILDVNETVLQLKDDYQYHWIVEVQINHSDSIALRVGFA